MSVLREITRRGLQALQLNQPQIAGVATPLLGSAAAATLQPPTSTRQRHTKHWNPKWKALRTAKVVHVDLPDFNEDPGTLTQDEMKSRMREKGLQPPRQWMERPFHVSSTGGVFEPYVPPEGDGKQSALSRGGAKQKFEFLEKKSKSMLAVRKIRSYEDDFDAAEFAQQVQQVYVEAHEALAAQDKYGIRRLVTERAYPEMMWNVKYKTIRWRFLKSLEAPRVVHARCTDVISKDNIFAQVTVRFHTQQTLAIYDRFGRLMHGSEIVAKDVLEYVVFEKHLSNEYGVWRLHDKLIPDWMPAKEPAPITYRIDDTPAALEAGADGAIGEGEKVAQLAEGSTAAAGGEQTPKLATA